MPKPTDKQGAIRDAHINLLLSTDRLIKDAETVKRDRDRLMQLVRVDGDDDCDDQEADRAS